MRKYVWNRREKNGGKGFSGGGSSNHLRIFPEPGRLEQNIAPLSRMIDVEWFS